jgi:hypothetical protein
LVIPSGDLLCWSFIALLKFQLSNPKYFTLLNNDGLVKSQKTPFFVIPAKAGIQCFQELMADLDPGCSLSRTRCGAGVTTFYEFVK